MGEINVSISEGITEEIVWHKEVENNGNWKRSSIITVASAVYQAT
jgi:hypothetical protein